MENMEMEGSSAKKSISLEALVSQNTNVTKDLKEKLKDIIKIGKDYDADVSSCIKTLINSADQDIVLLSIQAVSELVKSEEKIETYAQKDIIQPILNILQTVNTDQTELIKQCCRALGNLCCDCDTSRKIILEYNGVVTLKNLLQKCLDHSLHDIKLLVCKTLLNFGIGGQEFCELIVKEGIPDLLHRILLAELNKDDFDDDTVSTALLLLSVLNDNIPELLHSDDINKDVLNVLENTTNMDISEMCLDYLNTQAEHDSVKTLIANEGGVQQICARLELLIEQHEARKLISEDSVVETIIKQACDLIVIVLTGDEAMHTLYQNGTGEVYQKMVQWMDSPNSHLLTTAVLGIGNFARQDNYCYQMIENKIYDKLLDIFAAHITSESAERCVSVCAGTLGALRNLSVSEAGARAGAGRGAALLAGALPALGARHPQLAYKLLGALRMLVRQPAVARRLAERAALRAAVGAAAGGGAAAAEAARLLAAAVRELRHDAALSNIVQTEGCIACIMNMLVTSHSVMQNEAILALTLLAIDSLKKHSPGSEPDFDYEKSFTTQLVDGEIGKHVAILVDTNWAKMPIEVAENLIAFLEITSKKNEISLDYKEAKVHDSLKKFAEARIDLSEDLKVCIAHIIKAISNED